MPEIKFGKSRISHKRCRYNKANQKFGIKCFKSIVKKPEVGTITVSRMVRRLRGRAKKQSFERIKTCEN